MKSRPWGQRKCRDLRLSGFSLTSSRHKSVSHEGISINGRGFDGTILGKLGPLVTGHPGALLDSGARRRTTIRPCFSLLVLVFMHFRSDMTHKLSFSRRSSSY
jgi:hypothetical protein